MTLEKLFVDAAILKRKIKQYEEIKKEAERKIAQYTKELESEKFNKEYTLYKDNPSDFNTL